MVKRRDRNGEKKKRESGPYREKLNLAPKDQDKQHRSVNWTGLLTLVSV